MPPASRLRPDDLSSRRQSEPHKTAAPQHSETHGRARLPRRRRARRPPRRLSGAGCLPPPRTRPGRAGRPPHRSSISPPSASPMLSARRRRGRAGVCPRGPPGRRNDRPPRCLPVPPPGRGGVRALPVRTDPVRTRRRGRCTVHSRASYGPALTGRRREADHLLLLVVGGDVVPVSRMRGTGGVHVIVRVNRPLPERRKSSLVGGE